MKQIYYTQCPIGYGLGASNGFQIKRLSDGYPVTSDFRHLGLRAFIPGTRQMAPAALRYRHGNAGEAEVAFLTPRSHEYETERGFWGRPGGHFAHGLQLDAAELEAIHGWPAGLYDAAFWVRTDRGPSLDSAPPAIAFPPPPQEGPGAFERATRLGQALGPAALARLLTAVAVVVREGRTLFLIDAPERLAAHVALLTFAFPEPLRRGLTFSTYHDRPEELPGLRLQGTTAAARPNRGVLLSLGLVADVEKRALEPEVVPAAWAEQLAAWLTRGGDVDQRSFEATHRRARSAAPLAPAACWESEWLDALVAVEAALTENLAPPDWHRFARLATWCGDVGLGDEWAQGRGSAWWTEHAADHDGCLAAIVAHLRLPAAWKAAEAPTVWGKVFARAYENQSSDARSSALREVLSVVQPEHRPTFVRSVLRHVPAPLASETLEELRTRSDCGPALLLPLTIRSAVDSLYAGSSPQELHQRLLDALALPSALVAVLDALADAASAYPDAPALAAPTLAEAFGRAGARERSVVLNWALGRQDAAGWLGPILRRAFADPLNVESWRAIRARVPGRHGAAFASTALAIARDATLPDEAFRWCIEEALLVLPAGERPHDASWAREYLGRTPSDLDLIRWLYVKQYVKPGIKAWLTECRRRGELTSEQELRLDACKEYTRVLRVGDARALLDVRLPIVPAEDRGAVLGQILGSVDTAATNGLDLALEAVRDAWPAAFDAGAPGLPGLGQALAVALGPLREDAASWFERLTQVLQRLGLGIGRSGFESNGLAAEVLAATHADGRSDLATWRLRHHVLQSDLAWRALAADVRGALARHPGARSLDALERWDSALEKGLRTARFFEVWLNVCDGPALGLAVASRASAVNGFDLAWWDHGQHAGARDDLRDAFARLAPLVPLNPSALLDVEKWITPPRRAPTVPVSSRVYDEGGLAPLLEESPPANPRAEPGPARLSALGEHRWACMKTLSEFDTHGIEALGRWGRLLQPKFAAHLAQLDAADGYRFLAWLIHLSDEFDEVPVSRLAAWLYRAGCTDVDRVGIWHEELAGLARIPDESRLGRAHLVAELRDEMKRVANDERERRRIARPGGSP